jgi:hypothetical protein
MFAIGHLLSLEELRVAAVVTPSDIADAKRVSSARAPQMQPAFDAELIDPELDPGPIPDSGP